MHVFKNAILLLAAAHIVPTGALATPKAIYTDPETGLEVWRMTDHPGRDITQYYHNPTFSPDGRYFVIRTSRKPYLWIMNADGSGEKPVGTWDDWFRPGEKVDFSKGVMLGYWSHDSKVFYAWKNLYTIDIHAYMNGDPAASFIEQVSPSHADQFYHPFVSPDGRRLFGLSNSSDVYTGYGLLKIINVDGSGYREFVPAHRPANCGFDVSHGWLGNERAWYMVQIGKIRTPQCCYHDLPVFDVNDGSHSGCLDIPDPDGVDVFYDGFGHPTFSPEAYSVGGGRGLIAGHGRYPSRANGGITTTLIANTKYWTQDPRKRELQYILDRAKYPTFRPYGFHDNFDPSGKWLLVVNSLEDKGVFTAYPMSKDSEPVRVARFAPASIDCHPSPTWSSDGTKILFDSKSMLEPGNEDIYMVIFKKPEAPSDLVIKHTGSAYELTWKPAAQHREVKEYAIWKAASMNGQYQKIAAVPAVYTYLEAPSKISPAATTIVVDSTDEFPSQGTIEILGLSTERPTELVSYAGKTATSFTACTRGVMGSLPAEHYNDAFVWKYTGSHGYTVASEQNAWYKVRAVEWSGIASELSDAATANDGD